VQTYYRWRKEFGGLTLDSTETSKGAGEGERDTQATGGGAVFGEADFEGCSGGKLLSPERRRSAVEHARRKYGVSEREACRVLKQWRGMQRCVPLHRNDEDALIIELASEYGHYVTDESRRCCKPGLADRQPSTANLAA
jgi:putative transposase